MELQDVKVRLEQLEKSVGLTHRDGYNFGFTVNLFVDTDKLSKTEIENYAMESMNLERLLELIDIMRK